MSDTHSHSVAFVRETSIPQSAPPAAEQGIVKWMRENLFAGWANSLLTVASIYVIFLILRATMPWLFNGVWTTSSLADRALEPAVVRLQISAGSILATAAGLCSDVCGPCTGSVL